MKMKKILLCGIIAVLSIPMMAESSQEILKQARNEYYKNLDISDDIQPEVTREKIVTIDEEGVVDESSERVKPKSSIEKLEYNVAKAMDRIDFYERVVRSVQREEKELGVFDSVLARDGVKKAKRTRKIAK
ncbi:hypothetical protein HMPREF1552_01703 [Leptotrichia sp. oral taxon 879 str. F0557]|nr:hypothetical protein HMPREF1552_01703 [Leptotrichia sp. oral taxon 879 str. F0557]